MKVILIGFATSYKSSVAQLIGKKFGLPVIDTDLLIETQQGQTISQIFAQNGEEYFRNLEQQVVEQLIDVDNVVISCGGGTPLAPNFCKLAQSGIVVWLQVSATSAKYRMTKGTRPLFDSLSVEQLQQKIQRRAPIYQQYAQHVVSTDHRTSTQVANKVYNIICK
ncbi:MAG: shikimate kinase [Clostridia bacterium]|nr:shikimate kinase [Clostridia bacterium]